MPEENTQEVEKQETPEVEGTLSPEDKFKNDHEQLFSLSKEELIKANIETRSEAKTRRLRTKELESKLAENERQKQLEEEKALEEKNEFKTLYEKTKEQYSDYDDLKSFKENFLEDCKKQIDDAIVKLSPADKELFELASEGKNYDAQLKIIQKLTNKKQSTSMTDTSQSTGRPTGQNYTKAELLADTKLMAEVKANNPTLYAKLFST